MAGPAVESNLAWLARGAPRPGAFGSPGDVVLLGGASLADFRLRVAQSHVRDDLTPSYWSLVGVLDEGDRILTAPLWPLLPPEIVPITNGILSLPLTRLRRPGHVAEHRGRPLPDAFARHPVECVDDLRKQRAMIDLPALVLHWLAFVWGAGSAPNPLVNGSGLPSAVMTEAAFGLAEVELTPGPRRRVVVPRGDLPVRQVVAHFYEQAAGGRPKRANRPIGKFLVRETTPGYERAGPPAAEPRRADGEGSSA